MSVLIMRKMTLQALRPGQWNKNIFLFAGLVFSKNLFHLPSFAGAILGFVVFCLLSSSAYLLNDVMDKKEDRAHPVKRLRPVASGRMSVRYALFLSAGLLLLSLALSMLLPLTFTAACAVYAVLMIAYSSFMKHVVILDVFLIAAGFIVRALAGALAIEVPISSWLLVCTMFLAMLLGFIKRRQELVLLGGNAHSHRKILGLYSISFLDHLIVITATCSLLGYALYAASPETVYKTGTERLIFTVPFVFYGVFRYLYLVYQKGMGGSPEAVFWRDKPTILNATLYGGAVTLILYLI